MEILRIDSAGAVRLTIGAIAASVSLSHVNFEHLIPPNQLAHGSIEGTTSVSFFIRHPIKPKRLIEGNRGSSV